MVDLPSHIQRLANTLPLGTGLSAADIIHKHTLFPFYAAYTDKVNAEKAFISMLGDNGGDIHTRLGVAASSITVPSYLRYCTACVKEDVERNGEPYWHRIHQVPGVLLCPNHAQILHASTIPYRPFNKHDYVAACPEYCQATEDILGNVALDPQQMEHLLAIGRMCQQILDTVPDLKPLSCHFESYQQELIKTRFIKGHRTIAQDDLAYEFEQYYGRQLLKFLESEVNAGDDCCWLKAITRKHRKSFHPARHLLFARFLQHEVSTNPTGRIPEPFGKGPWPCLNHVAEHNKQNVIKNVEITLCERTGVPIGTFTCDCGFVYTRRGPETGPQHRFEISTIKEFGPVWEQKLKEVVSSGASMRATARALMVDPGTVRKYATLLGLNAVWLKPSQKQVPAIETKTEIEQQLRRQKWLDLQQTHPELSKTDIRKIDRATYAWLYRNDLEWLKKNSPVKSLAKRRKSRVNWEERDKEILREVNDAIEILLKQMPPERITITRIGKQIGQLSFLEKHLAQIPKTQALINSRVEDIEAYQIRRIKWAARSLHEEGLDVKQWSIERLAGLRPIDSNAIKLAIDAEIKKYNIHKQTHYD